MNERLVQQNCAEPELTSHYAGLSLSLCQNNDHPTQNFVFSSLCYLAYTYMFHSVSSQHVSEFFAADVERLQRTADGESRVRKRLLRERNIIKFYRHFYVVGSFET